MPRKTITREEIARLSFVNASQMPKVIEIDGMRKRWVGIGWIDEGKPTGREVLVVDAMRKKDQAVARDAGNVRKLPVRRARR